MHLRVVFCAFLNISRRLKITNVHNMGSFFRYVCSILPLFFFTVCYTSSTRDDLKDKQSAYFSERIRNTASPSCNTFVTLFSNGRVHLCKLDRANPRPSRSLNNTLDALLPNSNKSLMETHTMQTLPPFSNVHTHTHTYTPVQTT